jgi:GT2 family glycosyltransferase
VSAAPTTVLLLSVDEAPMLRASLPAARGQAGAEVVVIDNACTDETVALAEAAGVRVLRLERRLTYAAAINAALAATQGEAESVLLLNADCFLAPGFLVAARAALADPAVGSVAPRLLRATGPEVADRVQVIDAAGMTIDRRRKNGLVGHGAPAWAYLGAGEAFGADGAAALYRRGTLADCALGGDGDVPEVLDPDMELWASDADLAWRARLIGWRCAYAPDAVAWHVRTYSPTTRARTARRHRRLQFRNRLLMVAKNERGRDLLRDLPWIAGYEVLALGHVLLRERFLLGGYLGAARLLGAACRRRALVQARARSRVPFGLAPPR